MTVQPFAAYSLANSRPMPEFAPVIITVAATAAGSLVIAPSNPAPHRPMTRPVFIAHAPGDSKMIRPHGAETGPRDRYAKRQKRTSEAYRDPYIETPSQYVVDGLVRRCGAREI